MLAVEKEKGLWLQSRDFEILRFCLEMKFADIESLNQNFFDPLSQEMFAARKRVQKLESGNFLKSISMLSGSAKKFYLTTPKGYRELSKLATSKVVPKPVTKLSVVTFEHDLGVLRSRMKFEKQGRASEWRSERLLKASTQAATQRLSRNFMPDAIFTSKQGRTCALEYENRPKSENDLREKIFRLKALMEEKDPVFEACLFIASTDHLKKRIRILTDLIPNRFIVESLNDLNCVNQEENCNEE
jgi:hypothetical protein